VVAFRFADFRICQKVWSMSFVPLSMSSANKMRDCGASLVHFFLLRKVDDLSRLAPLARRLLKVFSYFLRAGSKGGQLPILSLIGSNPRPSNQPAQSLAIR
jgi:hypothetical protein